MEEPVMARCPWCGESFQTFFDPSAGVCTYTEDCQVCCRPVSMRFSFDEQGETRLTTERE